MTDEPLTIPPRYLGDGVYASFDGYHIWLETVDGNGRNHKIALEPAVFDALHCFEQDIRTFYESQNQTKPEQS
jgi:hypothetical protein